MLSGDCHFDIAARRFFGLFTPVLSDTTSTTKAQHQRRARRSDQWQWTIKNFFRQKK